MAIRAIAINTGMVKYRPGKGIRIGVCVALRAIHVTCGHIDGQVIGSQTRSDQPIVAFNTVVNNTVVAKNHVRKVRRIMTTSHAAIYVGRNRNVI